MHNKEGGELLFLSYAGDIVVDDSIVKIRFTEQLQSLQLYFPFCPLPDYTQLHLWK